MRSRDLLERERLAVDEGLPRQLLDARHRRFERGERRDFHLRPGAPNLGLVEIVGGLAETIERGGDEFAGLAGRAAGVEAEQAGLRIAPVERVDRIGEAALLAHFLKQPRRHAPARRGREHLRRVMRFRGHAAAFERDDDVALLERLLQQGLAAAIFRRRRFGRGGVSENGKLLGGERRRAARARSRRRRRPASRRPDSCGRDRRGSPAHRKRRRWRACRGSAGPSA